MPDGSTTPRVFDVGSFARERDQFGFYWTPEHRDQLACAVREISEDACPNGSITRPTSNRGRRLGTDRVNRVRDEDGYTDADENNDQPIEQHARLQSLD